MISDCIISRPCPAVGLETISGRGCTTKGCYVFNDASIRIERKDENRAGVFTSFVDFTRDTMGRPAAPRPTSRVQTLLTSDTLAVGENARS